MSVPYALFSANSTPGPIGPAGAQGPAGIDGATGPAGAQGPAGNDGATGPAGPQGPAGNDGATGPQGPAGAQGPAGIDGATGPAGAQGPAGNDGATGPQGPAGINGTNGIDGATGPAGPQGPAGNDGATGPAGSFPPGTVAGEMNYWNGTAWVTIAPGVSLPGNQALTLSLCNGVPTWEPCPAVLPSVSTAAVSSIAYPATGYPATGGGTVSNDGGAAVTARGVCWSTTANPTTANSYTTDGSGTGSFTSNLSGLTPFTTYYVRAYATNSVGTAYGNEVSFTTDNNVFLTIGQSYQGGKVAYILQPGDPGYDASVQHGLIAAPSDQGTAQWGCYGFSISGADGTAIGTGAQNTIDIMNGCSTAGIAARLCGDLVLGGYSDWYLPSRDELYQLYLNRVAIGGFADGAYYWSSAEGDGNFAWYFPFLYGYAGNGYKNFTYYVRAVRAF